MSLKNIIITGSIGSIATQSYGQRIYISSTEEQSFPIEHITGSDAKAWPNFVQGTNYTVDLVVNVTQSWSGSNITPLGITPYVHNTMEEFVNGEFSGSNYVVTDGNLNDAQCEQFLTVGTTPTYYSVFSYFQNLNPNPTNVFLNPNTTPRNGEILILYNNYTSGFTYGVYVKIARVDSSGTDNTLSLQELSQFRYIDNTAGEITFNIVNITEYPSYYLYEVTTNTTSVVPTDWNILDYSFSASSAISSVPVGSTYLDQWTIINNASGYWDGSNAYSFALTPNTTVYFTASITATNWNVSSISFDFGFWENNYAGNITNFTPVKTTSSLTIAGGGTTATFTLTGSYQFIGTTYVQYHLETYNVTAPISLSNVFWIMTQSQNPSTVNSSSIIIEPYLLSNFANSDCDVLMNNYSENDISTTHQKILYANGGTIPSNLQQIISGTAEYAQINDYLFNANANVLPRYQGVRFTSDNFNDPSTFTSNTIQSVENVYLGTIDQNVPSVSSLNTIIAYVDWWGNWAPERMNSSGAHVKYLINADGTVTIPNASQISLFANQDTFRSGEKVSVYIQNETVPSNTSVEIVRGATKMAPIMYNQVRDYTRPPMSFTSSIYFTDNNASSSATVDDFTATLGVLNNTQIGSGTFTQMQFNSIIQQGKDAINGELSIPAEYKITQQFLNNLLDLVLEVNVVVSSNTKFEVAFYKNNTSNTIKPVFGPSQGQTNLLYTVKIPFAQLNLNDTYGVVIRNVSQGIIYTTDSTFKITTNPLPTPAIDTAGMFITSSDPNSGSFIFMSSSVSSYYGNSQIQQEDISGSLFDPISLPFEFKLGDEIRFEGDETKVFMIENVRQGAYWYDYATPSISQSAIEIKLNNQISGSNSNLDQFLVRRYVDDASMILLKGYKPIDSTGPYLLRPTYIVPELDKNLDQVIVDLTQKGLI